jgi:hypothetical protein
MPGSSIPINVIAAITSVMICGPRLATTIARPAALGSPYESNDVPRRATSESVGPQPTRFTRLD